LGAIHALSHPIGALYGTHHGTTNAVVMPAVLRFNRPAIEEKITQAGAYLGVTGGFDGFLEWVLRMCDDLSIPKTLRELGVQKDALDTLAAMAEVDPTAGGNPVELTRERARELLEAAF
ncbi:MAG: iron-containing alcohol dehydrogenase, partial [Pseudomonadota bacterium]